MSLVEDLQPTYSSINSLSTNQGDDVLEGLFDDADAIINDEENKLNCEINLNADNYRLCKTKAAHDAVLGKIHASLAKNTLTTTEAPLLDTKSLIAKLDDVAKTADLVVPTILAEQIKDPIVGFVRSWLRKGTSPEAKAPESQRSKRFLRYSTDS